MKKIIGVVIACYLLTIILNQRIHQWRSSAHIIKTDYTLSISSSLFGLKSIFFCWHWLHLLFEDQDFIIFYQRVMRLINLDSNANLLYRYAALRCMFFYRQPACALHILKQGLSSLFNRDDWRIYVYMAHIHAHCYNDTQQAQKALQQLAQNALINDAKFLKYNWPRCPAHISKYRQESYRALNQDA